MAETYIEKIHTENAVLDIGEDIGALVIYTGQEMLGKEIEVSPKGNQTQKIHRLSWNARSMDVHFSQPSFSSLPEGDYFTFTTPSSEITIIGGQVTELHWQASNVIIHPKAFSNNHPHQHGNISSQRLSEASTTCPRDPAYDILPPRYRNGKVVSSAPMGTAPMRYTENGQVAWDEMWTDFCDLALAGGPPHRDTLLEPVPPDEVKADMESYERVLSEIERGWQLVTGLPTVRSEKLGWIGLQCHNEEMALWILRAIVVENVYVRREGNILYLPAGPAFRIDKEIKNVVTVVAKTHHYWTEHIYS